MESTAPTIEQYDHERGTRREAGRQRRYQLTALVRSLLTQEIEVCLPLLDSPDPNPRSSPRHT